MAIYDQADSPRAVPSFFSHLQSRERSPAPEAGETQGGAQGGVQGHTQGDVSSNAAPYTGYADPGADGFIAPPPLRRHHAAPEASVAPEAQSFAGVGADGRPVYVSAIATEAPEVPGYGPQHGHENMQPPVRQTLEGGGRRHLERRPPVYYFGAVLSLALVAGLGLWGWKLAMRDVNGIPVVRAIEGDMRVAPEDPGGQLAAHQGLTVNEVRGGGAAASVADSVILAPPPVDLIAADHPVPIVASAQRAAQVEAEAENTLVDAAVANAVLASLTVEGDGDVSPNAAPAAAPTARIEIIPASVPGVSVSRLPVIRPPLDLSRYTTEADRAAAEAAAAEASATTSGTTSQTGAALVGATDATEAEAEAQVAAQIAAPSEEVATSGRTLDVDPNSLVPGTSLVQLGAFDSVEMARSEWARISGNFAGSFESKQRLIQHASSGGRAFYRLRVVGFEDMSGARRFCSELIAGNAACIPVPTR